LDSDGNRRARWMMVQLAWIWVRQQPDSPLAREFQAKAGGRGSRVRRSQIVAIARKLLIALWRYVSVGVVPENAIMAR
jgi:transposase